MRFPNHERHLLGEIARTQQVLMALYSKSVGMPASRLNLLRALAFSEEALGVLDLARRLEIHASAVTRQVQELEDEGLVRRKTDPRDGRRCYVRMSPKGVKVFQELHSRLEEMERSISMALGAEEVATATAFLGKLRSFLERS